MVVFSLLSLLVLTLVLPLIPYAVAERGDLAGKVVNPGAELWREVRQRDRSVAGTTQVQGVDTGILINIYGEDWRRFRMQQLIPWGAALMGTVLSIILLFYLVRGPLRMQGGPTGKKIRRFTVFERTAHWFTVRAHCPLVYRQPVLAVGADRTDNAVWPPGTDSPARSRRVWVDRLGLQGGA
jgi:formate dehydrogenase subunit gamma